MIIFHVKGFNQRNSISGCRKQTATAAPDVITQLKHTYAKQMQIGKKISKVVATILNSDANQDV
jgi:hypothetical protein